MYGQIDIHIEAHRDSQDTWTKIIRGMGQGETNRARDAIRIAHSK